MFGSAIALAVAALLTDSPVEPRCGAERRTVKTLTDSGAATIKREPKTITVEELIAIHAPPFREDRPRNQVEKTVYAVTANVVGFKLETGDGDYHVVIAGDSGATMIAELPDPACVKGSVAEKEITSARTAFVEQFGKPLRGVYRKLGKPIHVRLVGVGFFDLLHRQTGVASNGIELHPILRIELIGS